MRPTFTTRYKKLENSLVASIDDKPPQNASTPNRYPQNAKSSASRFRKSTKYAPRRTTAPRHADTRERSSNVYCGPPNKIGVRSIDIYHSENAIGAVRNGK